ncbi:hypothetical protein ABPG72_009189 [Tetrahymena utriculariae]
MSSNPINRVYDFASRDDIIPISRKDFEETSRPIYKSQRLIPFEYLDMDILNGIIDMPDLGSLSFPWFPHLVMKGITNFNQLDYLETEQSSQSGQVTDSMIQKRIQDNAQNNGNNGFQNKSNSSSLTDIKNDSAIKSNMKSYKPSQKDILNNEKNLDPFTLLKKKYMSKKLLRQQIIEQDQDIDLSQLTYYQRKKNFIQKMKEEDMLLDWDSIKKEEKLYEISYISGASRKRKGKKRDQDQQNSQQIESSTALQPQIQQTNNQSQTNNNINVYQKEAKSYRKVPRSSRYDNQNGNKIDDDKVGHGIQEKDITKDKLSENEEENIIDQMEIIMEEAPLQELELRKQDFKHQQFLKEKYQNKNYIYISSKAQACIPQIRPIEDVRNSWVLKDLDSLLAFKKSPEYDSLEQYMNKFFGVRTPQQVFSILKQNHFNLKNAIDYCNMNSAYLKDYFSFKDLEAKKKLNKRRAEKKSYL